MYEVVADLSFLDDPEIFVAADQARGLKEIKGFIELLLAKNTKK